MTNAPRVLVTGATGLVGNNVVRLLLERGHRVSVLQRAPGPIPRALAGLAVEHVHASLSDEAALERAIAGHDAVVHSAAMVHVGWRHEREMREANVAGTANVAEATRRAGARLVQVSSVDAIGLVAGGVANEETPPGGMVECPYVVTKREAEHAVQEAISRGLDAVIVNPVYMLGPWDWRPSSGRMLLEIVANKGLFAPAGGNDFVDVRDVAAGVLAAMQRGARGRRYILGGHRRTYLDAWRLFAKVTGGIAPLGVAPRPLARLAGRMGDLVGRWRAREPAVNSAAVEMSLLPHHFSCERAQAELGYSFRSLEETVEHAWRWFCEAGYATARA